MKYLSVCSGIEAASAAWHSIGWQPVAFSEIEPFPCSVLSHRFPDVPNLGDMTQFMEWNIESGTVDILVGGTPCQPFSIAGLRGGLTDGRGNLALTYCQILQKFKPRWFIWENVPGVLSSNGGRDFGSILGAMVELGYGIAYRILDAQYFGVPQRRRRVFIVGCAGDWERAGKVLFEPGCVRGDFKASRKTKSAVAALTATGVGTCGADDNQGQAGNLIAHSLRGEGFDASEDGTGRGTPLVASPITSRPYGDRGAGEDRLVASAYRTAGDGAVYSHGDRTAALTTATDPSANIIMTSTGNQAHCLNAGGMGRQDYETATMVVQRGVRRLTPRECERLQGFPDDWTLVPHRGKPAADGPRYKAIGNSMAVPVMRWIGKRIEEQALK